MTCHTDDIPVRHLLQSLFYQDYNPYHRLMAHMRLSHPRALLSIQKIQTGMGTRTNSKDLIHQNPTSEAQNPLKPARPSTTHSSQHLRNSYTVASTNILFYSSWRVMEIRHR